MIKTISVAALAIAVAHSGYAQTGASAGMERADRPGGTSAISPTPGPATSPALPSATTPAVTIANRQQAQATKAARKAQKKAKKTSKASDQPAAPSRSADVTAPVVHAPLTSPANKPPAR